MVLYAISGGRGEIEEATLIAAAQAGVDWIQIREPGLSGRALYELCLQVRRATAGTGARILLNRRLDIAMAAGLDGIQLPATGLPVAVVRPRVPAGFLIGLSCHSVAEVAAADGADFCLLGPIFPTPSKERYGAPLGPKMLSQACRTGRDVVAVGGISLDTVEQCLAAGAAGVAAIRLFQEHSGQIVERLRGLGTRSAEST